MQRLQQNGGLNTRDSYLDTSPGKPDEHQISIQHSQASNLDYKPLQKSIQTTQHISTQYLRSMINRISNKKLTNFITSQASLQRTIHTHSTMHHITQHPTSLQRNLQSYKFGQTFENTLESAKNKLQIKSLPAQKHYQIKKPPLIFKSSDLKRSENDDTTLETSSVTTNTISSQCTENSSSYDKIQPGDIPNNISFQSTNEERLLKYRVLRKKSSRKVTTVDLNIVTNNINGLQVSKHPYRLDSLFIKMLETNIDILLIQEINTNIQHPTFKQLLQATKHHHKGSQSTWAHVKMSPEVQYLPGGTAILVNPMTSRYISSRITDHLGRWAGVTLKLRNMSPITFLSTYQPPADKGMGGSISATSQQQRWLNDNHITRTVRQQYRKDMNTLLDTLTKQRHSIVLAGDFNEHKAENNVIQDAVEKFRLMDVNQIFQESIPTYANSNNTLDRILISSSMFSSVTSFKAGDKDSIIISDHFPLCMTLKLKSHDVGQETNIRHLTSNHLHKVTKYISEVHHQMEKSGLLKKINSLEGSSVTTSYLNKLDQQFVDIRLRVESKLRKQHNNWWHKDLNTWKQQLKEYNNQLKSYKKQHPRPTSSILDLLTKRQLIIQKFRSQAEHSFQIRHNIISKEIAFLSTRKPVNKRKINHLKAILRTERIREIYRKIKRKVQHQSVRDYSIQVKVDEESYEEIKDIPKIAHHISQYNQKHFNQAIHTPLATYKYEENPIINHQYINDCARNQYNFDKHQGNLIQSLIQKFLTRIREPTVESIDTEINFDDFKQKVKKWKERTSTSPSGLHLGHYKALIAPHSLSYEEDSPEKQSLSNQQMDILNAHLMIINQALKHRISLVRWQTVHSIVLFKDKDNNFLHRIRNIHIYEADYNLILKLKWEQAIALSENHNLLHPSQFGSRVSKRSTDPVFTEILQQEVARMSNLPFIQINYDAQACYDRIIPEVAFQISRKYGVSPDVIDVVRNTMSHSKFFIKLGSTVTQSYYSNTSENTMFGTGQGSGCSPHIWTMISSELFHLYSQDSSGYRISSPFEDSTHEIHITAYVDDVNTHHSVLPTQTLNNLLAQANRAAQQWSNILHISGGKLSDSKCNYYVTSWEASTTGRTKVINKTYPPLEINDNEGSKITIHNRNTVESHKSLGYLQSMSLPLQHQHNNFKEILKFLSKTLQSSSLDYKETRIMYHTIFTPKLQYISQLSSLPHNQLLQCIKQNNLLTLRHMGYSSSTPKNVYMGHKTFGGLELIDPYVLQGAHNLIHLTRCFNTQQANSTPVKFAYLWWRFKDGRSICPMKHTHTNESITESLWFPELSRFLYQYNINVKFEITFPPTLRQQDAYIMDIVHNTIPTKKEISNINQCRIYLHALTLSDITTVDGKHLEDSCYHHKIAKTISLVSYIPMVSKPNKSIWHYWSKFLDTLTYPCSRRLKIPLGDWVCSSNHIRRKYTTYRDVDSIYTRRNTLFRKTNLSNGSPSDVPYLPFNAIPCIYSFNTVHPSTYHTSVQDMPNTVSDQCTYIFPKQIIIATDASLHQGKAAIAWVITDTNGNIIDEHSSRLHESNISSFRAEAFGILSVLQKHAHHIKSEKISWNLYCDNKSVIQRAQQLQTSTLNVEWSDSDVLKVIQDNLPQLGNFHHIKGHQTITESSELSVKLNAYVDKKANEAITQLPSHIQLPHTMQIRSGTSQLFSVSNVITHCRKQVSITRWKQLLEEQRYNSIDWSLFNFLCTKQKHQVSVIKLFNDLTPSRERLYKLNLHQSPVCPICELTSEDSIHPILCSKNPYKLIAQVPWLQNTLNKYGDVNTIINQISQAIQLNNISSDNSFHTQQNLIGWKEFVKGKIALELTPSVIPMMKKEKTEQKFVRALCLHIINIWKKAWLFRVNNVMKQTEETNKELNKQIYYKKLKFIYQHKSYLNDDNVIFLQKSYNDHIKSSHAQIKTWIKIHYVSMHQEISQKLHSEKLQINKSNLDCRDPVRGSFQESSPMRQDLEII